MKPFKLPFVKSISIGSNMKISFLKSSLGIDILFPLSCGFTSSENGSNVAWICLLWIFSISYIKNLLLFPSFVLNINWGIKAFSIWNNLDLELNFL